MPACVRAGKPVGGKEGGGGEREGREEREEREQKREIDRQTEKESKREKETDARTYTETRTNKHAQAHTPFKASFVSSDIVEKRAPGAILAGVTSLELTELIALEAVTPVALSPPITAHTHTLTLTNTHTDFENGARGGAGVQLPRAIRVGPNEGGEKLWVYLPNVEVNLTI